MICADDKFYNKCISWETDKNKGPFFVDEKKYFELWLVYLGKYKPKHMEEYEKKIKKK